MYNRYIPNGTTYTRVVEEDAPPFRRPEPPRGGASSRQAHLPPPQMTHAAESHQAHRAASPGPGPAGAHTAHQPPPGPSGPPGGPDRRASWLSGLLKGLKLDEIDTGDILLLLILLFLFLDGDGDNIEMAIILGLLLLFSLGGRDKDKEKE